MSTALYHREAPYHVYTYEAAVRPRVQHSPSTIVPVEPVPHSSHLLEYGTDEHDVKCVWKRGVGESLACRREGQGRGEEEGCEEEEGRKREGVSRMSMSMRIRTWIGFVFVMHWRRHPAFAIAFVSV